MKKTVYSKKLTKKDKSPIHGCGIFALESIKVGEFLFSKGGHIMKKGEMFSSAPLDSYWPISDEYVLAPRNIYEVEDVVLKINHSCNPNCGIIGQSEGVAIREINKGEEITFDYALLDNELNWFKCNCNQDQCRKIITSIDWKIKKIQNEYDGHFALYIKEKIAAGEKYIVYYDMTNDIEAIRKKVFLDEQKIKNEDEFDGGESRYSHCCLYKQDHLIAYARVCSEEKTAFISRVAVDKDSRKKGLGREIMFWAEIEARKIGCTEISLHAQIQVREFYEKLGYRAIGEKFIEVGICHIKMIKML